MVKKRLVSLRQLAALSSAIAACGAAPRSLPLPPPAWTAATRSVVERTDAGPESERDVWLRSALRTGVPVSDRTALAVIGEDLVAIDRATFARSILAPAIARGRSCAGMRTATDALFVCTDDPHACIDVGPKCNARVLRVPVAGPFVPDLDVSCRAPMCSRCPPSVIPSWREPLPSAWLQECGR